MFQFIPHVLLSCSLMLAFPAIAAIDAEVLQQALAKSLPLKAVDALANIPDPGRKLLAARSYYRSQSTLDKHWSWSEDQIIAFEGSPEQKVLLADIALIADHFATANPGYSLYMNMKVRSLDKQIVSWNTNASVAAAAGNLLSALENDPNIILNADNAKLPDQLKAWLSGHAPNPSPNLAAPGLSAHGQMHAIDFQISKNGSLIAQANSAEIDSIWRAQGWSAKLKASITAAGPAFEGPLTSPDEPWHYNYTPHHEADEHVQTSP